MYFNKGNDFYHGIMFHHFHDNKLHKSSQGSIDIDDFYKIIKFVGRENILDAYEFFIRLKEKKLKEKNLCFTFDDGIKSQYDIALPILEDLKIKSFFFVQSSIFESNPSLLELSRYFRTNYFSNINDFYKSFYLNLGKDLNPFFKKKDKVINDILKQFPYYQIEDVKFRLVRDFFLTEKEYEKIMLNMFVEKNFNYKVPLSITFSESDLEKVKNLGHLVGLHSHTHNTLMENLSYNEQLKEYQNNINALSKILKINREEIKYMSHPCGSYNQDTIKILINLGIEIGFKETMEIDKKKNMKNINNSSLEIAREDHALIMQMMN